MGKDFTYFVDLSGIKFSEGQKASWLHAMPVGKVQHPWYGEMDFTEPALKMYADSVSTRVLGTVDPAIDYDHMEFSGIAAGWVKAAKVQIGEGDGDGLQLFVEWTDDAITRIKNKEYKYFSPMFKDEWVDQNGKKHQNVIFGGGITNRPYLKNLVPLNLSDLTFGTPALPSPVEDEMDMKRLREALGLPDGTSDDDTWKAFGERMKTQPTPEPNPTPNPAPQPTPVPTLNMSEEMRRLAETNPVVRDLIAGFEGQIRQAAEMQTKLTEQSIANKLTELDRSDLIITPRCKDLIHDVAVDLNEETGVKFWELLQLMMSSNAFVVELGERAKSGSRYSRDKTATQLFAEQTNALVAGGMAYADAVEKVSRDNPSLYDDYRNENFSFRA